MISAYESKEFVRDTRFTIEMFFLLFVYCQCIVVAFSSGMPKIAGCFLEHCTLQNGESCGSVVVCVSIRTRECPTIGFHALYPKTSHDSLLDCTTMKHENTGMKSWFLIGETYGECDSVRYCVRVLVSKSAVS